MIGSVLVANRGEIAVRLIRTYRELGLRTIAAYSDADARALHVRLADEARRLGPAPVTASYLNAEAVLAAAAACGSSGRHPRCPARWRRRPRRRPPRSGGRRSTWSGRCATHATSRCRCSPTRTAPCCAWATATARCSAATRS